MIDRNMLSGAIVSRPGERPRMRVQAGQGWVEGEHGQDLEKGFVSLTRTHGGEWQEVSRVAGAQVARCTAQGCDWATRPILAGRRTPEACEVCQAPAALEPAPDAGVVIELEQVAAPGKAWQAERAFRLAKPVHRAAAARAWATALLEERGVPGEAARTLLGELVGRKQSKASPAELEQLVRNGVELAARMASDAQAAQAAQPQATQEKQDSAAQSTPKRTQKGTKKAT